MKAVVSFFNEIYQILFWFSILFSIRFLYVFIILLIERISNNIEIVFEIEDYEKYLLILAMSIIISFLC